MSLTVHSPNTIYIQPIYNHVFPSLLPSNDGVQGTSESNSRLSSSASRINAPAVRGSAHFGTSAPGCGFCGPKHTWRIPSSNLSNQRWQWKIHHMFMDDFPRNLHCHVWLPEGKSAVRDLLCRWLPLQLLDKQLFHTRKLPQISHNRNYAGPQMFFLGRFRLVKLFFHWTL